MGNPTTKQTRRASWAKMKGMLNERQAEVLDAIRSHPKGLTAWEISIKTRRYVHAVRPRLTELKGMKIIYVAGKQRWPATDTVEALFKISKNPGQVELPLD